MKLNNRLFPSYDIVVLSKYWQYFQGYFFTKFCFNAKAELVTIAPGLRPERRRWLGDNISSLNFAVMLILARCFQLWR